MSIIGNYNNMDTVDVSKQNLRKNPKKARTYDTAFPEELDEFKFKPRRRAFSELDESLPNPLNVKPRRRAFSEELGESASNPRTSSKKFSEEIGEYVLIPKRKYNFDF